jgi:hypothetical protein
MKVKSGSVTLNNLKLSSKDITQPIKPGAKLILQSKSIVVVRQGKKMIQLTDTKPYSYSQISNLLKKQKESSASSYSNVLFSDEMQKSRNQVKSGAVTRGGAKAVNWQDVSFSLAKSFIYLGNELRISVQNEEVILKEVIVEYPNGRSESISIENGKSFFINTIEPGAYYWRAILVLQNEEVEPYAFESNFKIPDEKHKLQLLDDWQLFIREISVFHLDIQNQIKGEYLENNMLALPN